jgi:hypothetical protein
VHSIDENYIESVRGFPEERIGANLLNALTAIGSVDTQLVLALDLIEIFTSTSNADFQVASESPVADEAVDQLSSVHEQYQVVLSS